MFPLEARTFDLWRFAAHPQFFRGGSHPAFEAGAAAFGPEGKLAGVRGRFCVTTFGKRLSPGNNSLTASRKQLKMGDGWRGGALHPYP